jgi:hypothetical protein
VSDSATDESGSRDKTRRVCRTCGQPYEYPGHNSLATRTTCERCVDVPESVRRVLDLMRRRLDRLAREVEGLKKGRGASE